MSGRNFVCVPPSGLVLAIQCWAGDEEEAMRLARLIANIEPEFRDDVTLAFCRRFDLPKSELLNETATHCGLKFPVMHLQSERQGVDHPDGCNALAAGIFDRLSQEWWSGNLPRASVFLMEADGVPIARDWINRLKAEHDAALRAGKRVTGTVMDRSVPHVNGSMIMHLSTWIDRMSLRETPSYQAWDMFHAAVLMQECKDTPLIANIYGSKNLTHETIRALSLNAVWLSNVKDDSAIRWAETKLVDVEMRGAVAI